MQTDSIPEIFFENVFFLNHMMKKHGAFTSMQSIKESDVLISLFYNAGITITNSNFTVDFGDIFQIDKHLSIKLKIISYLFVSVVQKNHLLETVLLNTHNIFIGTEIRKNDFRLCTLIY